MYRSCVHMWSRCLTTLNVITNTHAWRPAVVVRERLAALDERREEDETTTKEIDTFEREKSVFYAHSVGSASYVHS